MADQERIVVEVNAGAHDRKNCFISYIAVCGCDCEAGHMVEELDAGGQVVKQIAAQCLTDLCGCDDDECGCGCEVVWMIDELKAGESKRYAIGVGQAEAAGGVEIDLQDCRQADIKVNGELFTSYVFQEGIARPFCYPVVGPEGKIIVREVNLPQKEGIDHPHHKGIWIAQGHVNDGEDNWSELNDHATTQTQQVLVLSEGPVFGELMAFGDWMSGRHGVNKKMLEEHTRIRVYNTPDNARIMDWEITFFASEGGFFFGDTKEAGTLSVRLQESMEERNGGTMRNAFGAIGEAENWGKRAQWVDYYGEVEGTQMGLTLMDHPDNHGFPAHWHVRSYGLFTVNQWGLHDFTGDPATRGDLSVREGDALTFRFRVFIHAGDTDAADVAGQYFNFIFPPTVTAVE
jgi:hypothetical protein